MDETGLVSRRQAEGDLHRDLGRPHRAHPTGAQLRFQIVAVQKLVDQEVRAIRCRARVGDSDDVQGLEPRGSAPFIFKSLNNRCRDVALQDLDCDAQIKLEVDRLVNVAEPTSAKTSDEAVAVQNLTDTRIVWLTLHAPGSR
jgi:hypothetical protein